MALRVKLSEVSNEFVLSYNELIIFVVLKLYKDNNSFNTRETKVIRRFWEGGKRSHKNVSKPRLALA